MIQTRLEIPQKDCWDTGIFFPSLQEWEKAFAAAAQHGQPALWPQLLKFRGQLSNSPNTLKEAVEQFLETERQLEKLYVYAHLRHDEEVIEEQAKKAFGRIAALLHAFSSETSWVVPELLALPGEKLTVLINDPCLASYRFYFEKIVRMRLHTLSAEKEELLAQAAQPLDALRKSFSAMNNADFVFGKVVDGEGKERELSHALYSVYLQDHDRILRQNAFGRFHQQFASYQNTLCEIIQGQMQSHFFFARAHRFSSSLEAALHPHAIDQRVYHALIESVSEQLPILHRYNSLRKRVLQLDELRLYDMYVPLIAKTEIKMTYDQAVEAIYESTAPLGKEYQEILYRGLTQDRWVDRYENSHKRSGAYSSGCYDSMPYILMNYRGILRDVFTLAHEAGHSMHSYLSQHAQPYHDFRYPIFLAEVASTFNEDLLTRYLLKQVRSDVEKILLINQQVEDIRSTFFRQTMFAEFELLMHSYAENSQPLTPQILKEEYVRLVRKYLGPEIMITDSGEAEWSRIPHFYYNYYVYQYATGISAALTLSDQVVNGGANERDRYLALLRGGGSAYPLDLLKRAGVDMTTPAPVQATCKKFGGLVDQLSRLIT